MTLLLWNKISTFNGDIAFFMGIENLAATLRRARFAKAQSP
ncbi:hypothetical protein [Polaromonas sp. CG9_12]|nr:hypothetical protein [Polaromonas sp. CG9_12]